MAKYRATRQFKKFDRTYEFGETINSDEVGQGTIESGLRCGYIEDATNKPDPPAQTEPADDVPDEEPPEQPPPKAAAKKGAA